ncbi:MAG TPA: superoxide dismutase [Fredinandcohnia sp.]|nr:superoxide dismutase [Fredinandcohnia sp.]
MSQKKSGSLDRREMLGLLGGAALAAPVLGASGVALAQSSGKKEKGTAEGELAIAPEPYTLPPLPYPKNALDGYLSAEILELHHDKHHAGYVKGLNNALAGLEEARQKGDFAQIKALERELAFHGSGHVLHTLYWNSMSPNGGGNPSPALTQALNASFGSVDAFRKQFAAASKAAEASAWGVLAYEPLGNRLLILAVEDHQNMGFQGSYPLLVCDVWEHAYYLRYKNDRGTYVDRFFEVINWDFAEQRLRQALRMRQS